jgi:hypothetical protein
MESMSFATEASVKETLKGEVADTPSNAEEEDDQIMKNLNLEQLCKEVKY